MDLFALSIAVPIGLTVGLWAHRMAAEDERWRAGLSCSIGLGVLGAIAGSWLAQALALGHPIAIWGGPLLAMVGAVVVVSVYHVLTSRGSRLR